MLNAEVSSQESGCSRDHVRSEGMGVQYLAKRFLQFAVCFLYSLRRKAAKCASDT